MTSEIQSPVDRESQPTPLLSVIVPVYKVEPYLRQALDSLLAQTYTNLEIICVDDGSPDGCPAILEEYAARDPRITVIHQTNQGVQAARNAGLEQATGEFVTFMDSRRSKFFSVKSLSSEQSTLASQVKQRWIHGIEARLLSAPQPSGEASLV